MRAWWWAAAMALATVVAGQARAEYGFVSCSAERPPTPSVTGIAIRNLSGGEQADIVPIIIAYGDWIRRDEGRLLFNQIIRAGGNPVNILESPQPRCRWYPDEASVVQQINAELKKLRKKRYIIVTTSWTPPNPLPRP